jgi:hypothetical protein
MAHCYEPLLIRGGVYFINDKSCLAFCMCLTKSECRLISKFSWPLATGSSALSELKPRISQEIIIQSEKNI